jgi:protein tyrosine/serine phosphatase
MKTIKAIVKGLLVSVLAVGLYLLALQASNNFHEVSPKELYRSAQLSSSDLAEYVQKYHIRSVLNLRGDNSGKEWYDDEVQESRQLNINYINYKMSSKEELTKQESDTLIALMKNAPKPLLIHCRSGADRTGLASALYLAAIKHDDEFSSELQLSLLYGHVPLWFIPEYAMNRTFEALEPSLGYIDS